MVTKKTRWLSAFAAMIMLVSMLAGIILPAGAATNSAILTALEAKYNALEQESFAEIKGKTVDEMRAQIAELIENYNQADNKYEREIYEQIGASSDDEFMAKNKGNLAPGLIVRYSLKGFYELMGYSADATAYYISDVADWEAAASSGSQFGGKTLLVTNDIDFGGRTTLPLTANVLTFQGVLDGQGHKFINYCLNIGGSNKYCGIVADLTGGTIKNLGVEGGTIFYSGKDPGGLSNEGVGTFAGYIGKNGLIQNCWSTATLSTSAVSDGKNGIAGIVGWGEGGAVDNCFFAGKVINTNADGAACDILGYGANYVKIYNSIGAGTLDCQPSKNPAAVGVHYPMYSNVAYFAIYNSYSVGHKSLRYRTNANPYLVNNSNDKNANFVTLPDTIVTFTKDIAHKFTPEETEAAYKLNSLEEAVWAVSKRFDTTHQSADRDYYISLDNEGKLYMSKTPEYFRRVIVEGSDSGVFYLKEGTTVNLVTDLGFLVSESITIDKKDYASNIDGQNITVPAEDITLTIKYSDDLVLNMASTKLYELVEKYKDINGELFKNGSLAEEWVAEARKELAKDPMSIEGIETMIELEKSFGSHITLKDGVYPKYTDAAKYAAFNKENNWAISGPEDWLKMVEESKADKSISYEGYTFHLTNDIDFNNVAMHPLCAGSYFRGSINGHGYGFDNVLINETTIESTYTYVGLICNATAGTFTNFGINSGVVDASKSNQPCYVGGLFGGIATDMASSPILIEKCWNGATVDTSNNGGQRSGSALAGFIHNTSANNALLTINGFLNTGKVTNHSTNTNELYTAIINSTSCMHNNNGIFNSLNTAEVISDRTNGGACFMRLSLAAAGKAVNNASVGNLPFLTYNSGSVATLEYKNGFATGVEAAYALNQGSTGLTARDGSAVAPVYYTFNEDGELRPTGTYENRIVKVTVMFRGEVMDTLYMVPGTHELNYENMDSYSVSGEATVEGNILTLGAGDAVVTCNRCDHKNGTITPIAGSEKHLVTCPDCGNSEEFDCTFDGVGSANDDLVIENRRIKAGTHTLTCECGNEKKVNCSGKLRFDPNDCTKNGYYDFSECCDRENTTVEGYRRNNHSWNTNWTSEDGVKESVTCKNCETKQYRVVGKVEAAAQSAVSAGSTVEVLVSTPVSMTEGTFNLSFMSNFTITKVEGEGFGWTAGTKVVTVTAPVAAGASFKVTLMADKFATVSDSTVDVSVTGAKDGDVVITSATASTEILFEKILGDADGDLVLTLMDPVLVLQHVVNSTVAINKENANVDAVAGVSVNDAIAIVRLWLKTSDV